MSYYCKTGKHVWLNPASAERCCDPDWSRELRRVGEFVDGDAKDGIVFLREELTGWMMVWHRRETK